MFRFDCPPNADAIGCFGVSRSVPGSNGIRMRRGSFQESHGMHARVVGGNGVYDGVARDAEVTTTRMASPGASCWGNGRTPLPNKGGRRTTPTDSFGPSVELSDGRCRAAWGAVNSWPGGADSGRVLARAAVAYSNGINTRLEQWSSRHRDPMSPGLGPTPGLRRADGGPGRCLPRSA